MTLGAVRLRQWRGDRTQAVMAHLLSVDQGLYSKWERGGRTPGRRPAMRIALITGGLVPMEAWDLPAPDGEEAKAS